MKKLIIPTILAVAGLSVLRFFQIFFAIDLSTGFYNYDSFWAYVLWAALPAAGIMIAICTFKNPCLENRKTILIPPYFSVFFAAMGLFFAADAVFNVFEISGNELWIFVLLRVITAFLAAVGMFATAFVLLTAGSHSGFAPVFFVFPVLYFLTRLILTFLSFTKIAGISQRVLELLNIVFMLVFFVYFAKLMISGNRGLTLLKTVTFSLFSPAAVLMTTLPAAVLFFFNQTKFAFVLETFTIASAGDFIFSAFALMFGFLALKMPESEKTAG